jgi:hypothetical protein
LEDARAEILDNVRFALAGVTLSAPIAAHARRRAVERLVSDHLLDALDAGGGPPEHRL